MVDTNNLQNEVNTLLGDKTPPEFQSPVMPVSQISNQPILRPAVEADQYQNIAPPIQSNPQSYIQPQIFEESKKNNYGMLIGVLVLLIVGSATAFTFRTKIFGPLTYSDCLKSPGSSHVSLTPRYCVMPDGDVFFENKNLITDESGLEPTPFDQSIVPGLEGY